jgi:hypothetical protein
MLPVMTNPWHLRVISYKDLYQVSGIQEKVSKNYDLVSLPNVKVKKMILPVGKRNDRHSQQWLSGHPRIAFFWNDEMGCVLREDLIIYRF